MNIRLYSLLALYLYHYLQYVYNLNYVLGEAAFLSSYKLIMAFKPHHFEQMVLFCMCVKHQLDPVTCHRVVKCVCVYVDKSQQWICITI